MANNGLSRLEHFIGRDMASLTLGNCVDALGRGKAATGDGYFDGRIADLRRDLLARCRDER